MSFRSTGDLWALSCSLVLRLGSRAATPYDRGECRLCENVTKLSFSLSLGFNEGAYPGTPGPWSTEPLPLQDPCSLHSPKVFGMEQGTSQDPT